MTIITKAKLNVPGFKKVYDELYRSILLSGKSTSYFENYIRSMAKIVLHFNKNPLQLSDKQINDYLLLLQENKKTSYTAFKHYVYALRYIFRLPRLLDYSKGKVTFAYKDYRQGGKKKEMTLSDIEFIQRYARHLLPKGFRRIRHFGFYNGAIKKKKVEKIRASIGQKPPKIIEWDWIKISVERLGYDPKKCPCCGERTMVIMPRITHQRAPPKPKSDVVDTLN